MKAVRNDLPQAKSDSPAATGKDAKSIVVATAGHIDHGKTALVYAMTGTNTDRLPEEKKRGITIDLGFAALRLPDGSGGMLDISLIDVPGHHAFIRNMLAGAGTVDCVMLVIAADEGVKAQTQEHLAICGLLGIRHGLVVLTKQDAVKPEHLERTRASVQRFLEHTFLEGAPILPVSAVTGEGIVRLKSALTQLVLEAPEKSDEYIPRLPLDRVFSMHGFGTVVTGTLRSGVLRVGDYLEQPGGRTVRVRGLQVHSESREAARAPCRVALNLADVEVAENHRGDTLVPPRTLVPVAMLDAEISILPGAPTLKHRSKVRVHAFTFDSPATVLLYESGRLDSSRTGFARVQLERPLVAIPGDRFVLRQYSPAITIGGGHILDAHPLARLKKSAALRWLHVLRDAGIAEQLRLRISRRGVEGIGLPDLVAETGLSPEAIRKYTEPLLRGNCLALSGSEQFDLARFVTTEALQQLMDAIRGDLERANRGSVSGAELRSRNHIKEQIFALAVDRLSEANQIEVKGDLLSLAGCGEQIPDEQRKRLNAVENIYLAAGLGAPLLSEVSARLGIGTKEMHGLITLLLRSKRLVRMGADNAFTHPHAIAKLYADLRKHRGQQFDVGRFKSFTGLTRKHAIPLLEHLDEVHVTRNTGGVRVVL